MRCSRAGRGLWETVIQKSRQPFAFLQNHLLPLLDSATKRIRYVRGWARNSPHFLIPIKSERSTISRFCLRRKLYIVLMFSGPKSRIGPLNHSSSSNSRFQTPVRSPGRSRTPPRPSDAHIIEYRSDIQIPFGAEVSFYFDVQLTAVSNRGFFFRNSCVSSLFEKKSSNSAEFSQLSSNRYRMSSEFQSGTSVK